MKLAQSKALIKYQVAPHNAVEGYNSHRPKKYFAGVIGALWAPGRKEPRDIVVWGKDTARHDLHDEGLAPCKLSRYAKRLFWDMFKNWGDN